VRRAPRFNQDTGVAVCPQGTDYRLIPIDLADLPNTPPCLHLSAQLPQRRPATLARLSKRQKSVNRIYGGALSHAVVKERIVRAFLIEEQKIVKKVGGGAWCTQAH
jgi:hypothetical protein